MHYYIYVFFVFFLLVGKAGTDYKKKLGFRFNGEKMILDTIVWQEEIPERKVCRMTVAILLHVLNPQPTTSKNIPGPNFGPWF